MNLNLKWICAFEHCPHIQPQISIENKDVKQYIQNGILTCKEIKVTDLPIRFVY